MDVTQFLTGMIVRGKGLSDAVAVAFLNLKLREQSSSRPLNLETMKSEHEGCS